MDAGFVDLDILLTKIRNAQSKAYFLDAVKAYKVGALRASMSSVWVALAYDLIAKYRELSAMGDASAAAFIASWDNATAASDTKKLLQLEGDILEDATANTQVINHLARTQLGRLREDRHLCAHPAFSAEAELFEPSPELVRLHLVNAVDLVLSQEPLQGKAIFELYDVDVQSPGFPANHARIIDYVEQRYLERVRAQNIRNFGTVLAKSLLRGVPAQWEPNQSKIVSSLAAVRERAPQGLLDNQPAAFEFLFVAKLPDAESSRIERGEYLVRNIVEVDPDTEVIHVADSIVEGQSIVFALREPAAAEQDLRRLLADIAPASGGPSYRFGLYFNCLARGRSLYRKEGVDSALLREALPGVPILGFFSNAEIGPLRGQNRLFTYTGVLLLVGE